MKNIYCLKLQEATTKSDDLHKKVEEMVQKMNLAKIELTDSRHEQDIQVWYSFNFKRFGLGLIEVF